MLLRQAGKIPTTGSNFPFKDLKRTFKDLKLAFKDLKHTFKVFERKIKRAEETFTQGRRKLSAPRGEKRRLRAETHPAP